MKNGYQLLILLNNKLNEPVLKSLTRISKTDFVKNEEAITIAIGFICEIKNIFGFVNSYKLYDVIKIDLSKLKEFLDNINNK